MLVEQERNEDYLHSLSFKTKPFVQTYAAPCKTHMNATGTVLTRPRSARTARDASQMGPHTFRKSKQSAK